MVVDGRDGQVVVSTREFDRVTSLNDGDTVVVHLTCSDDQSVTVMMPRTVMHAMVNALADDLIGKWNLQKPDA